MSIFKAEAKSLLKLFTGEANRIGFKIPEYQRKYDWGENNIIRLFEDILSGLKSLERDPDSITFLGSIILIQNQDLRESSFDGESLEIVDGQQRITSCAIVAVHLHEAIDTELSSLTEISTDLKDWLKRETNRTKQMLLQCVFGNLLVDGIDNFPFPRIVRANDSRAATDGELEYQSLTAKYFFGYAQHVRRRNGLLYEKPAPDKNDQSTVRFLENVKFIEKCIRVISKSSEEIDFGIELLEENSFKMANIRKLFQALPEQQDITNRYFEMVCGKYLHETEALVRLIIFANYFLENVILTVVTTRAEKYAFDIFDSLNTTGEPLTAIETFKPRVIRYEDSQQRKYKGSESESHFVEVEKYIDQFSKNSDKQEESRDLIIPFALLTTGDRCSRHLVNQRRYLRAEYDSIPIGNKNARRKFIKNLADIARFKNEFWNRDKLLQSLPLLADRQSVILCLSFLIDLKNTLAIPILTRLWVHSEEIDDFKFFADCVKALTAFVVLRRSATGGTAGIDSDLRGMMEKGGVDGSDRGMKTGTSFDRPIISLVDFKEILKARIERRPSEINSKESWLDQAKKQPLYLSSRPLCRFIILAASHNSRPSKGEPILLLKDRPSPELEYLSYRKWFEDDLLTIEHIAPDSDRERKWSQPIYDLPYLRHTIGNLTLLSQEQNSAIANYEWERKKLFYKAFSVDTIQEVEAAIANASAQGVSFSKRTKEMLRGMRQLPVARGISLASTWSVPEIEARTENLLALCWDEISPWLFDS